MILNVCLTFCPVTLSKKEIRMRKRIPLLLVLVMMLALAAGVIRAAPVTASTATLQALAQYYPADTPLYASIRADDDVITELDALLARLAANLGEPLPPGFSVADLLDEWTFTAFGRSFERSFGPWLGDSAAVGLLSFAPLFEEQNTASFLRPARRSPPPLVIAFSVVDRDAAETFAAALMEAAGLEPVETGEYTLYDPGDDLALLIADDAALIGPEAELLRAAFEGRDGRLSDAALFNETVSGLPLETYSALAYFNVEAMNRELLEMMQAETPRLALSPLLRQQFEIGGGIALGLTVIAERSLTIDMAVVLTEEALRFAREMPGYLEPQPVDLEFLWHVPADAQFVIHYGDFGGQMLTLLAQLDLLGPLLGQQFQAMLDDPRQRATMDPEMVEFFEVFDLSGVNLGGALKVLASQMFAGFTGLHLEDEVLSWMTGDYALYARLIAADDLPFSVDAAFLTETTDAAAAANVIDKLELAADLYGVPITRQGINAGEALALTMPLRPFHPPTPPGSQETLTITPALDFLIGHDAEVFVIGTRPGAEAAFAPAAGGTLLDDATFRQARETLFLPEPASVFFINGPALWEALPLLGAVMPAWELRELLMVAAQVESATITATALQDRTMQARLTLTIPEQAVTIWEQMELEFEAPVAVATPEDDAP
jgi:hypothetical protein